MFRTEQTAARTVDLQAERAWDRTIYPLGQKGTQMCFVPVEVTVYSLVLTDYLTSYYMPHELGFHLLRGRARGNEK